MKTSEENAKLSEEIFARAISERESFDKRGIEYDSTVLNVLEFVELLQCDLNWLLNDLVQNQSTLRGSLYSRMLVLTIYESCKSLKKLLAREFRDELTKRLGLKDDIDLKHIHSRFSQLFERCSSDFGEVRNGIIGHWDCDPKTRIALLKQANPQAVADLVIEMIKPLRELLMILLPYVRHVMEAE